MCVCVSRRFIDESRERNVFLGESSSKSYGRRGLRDKESYLCYTKNDIWNHRATVRARPMVAGRTTIINDSVLNGRRV